MPEQNSEPSTSNQVIALARGLDILRCFSAREPSLSNSEIATYTGLPKSTVSRLTRTLVELGYLRHDKKNRRYLVGPSVLALGYSALANLRVADIARPGMQRLANTTDALISLATRDRLSMMYLAACSTDASMTLRMGPGVRMPIVTTSIGRAFLGALPRKERNYLISTLQQKPDSTLNQTRLDALEREIRRFEKMGYTLSMGEWHKDVNAAATAISWSGGTDLIVISISGPSFQITRNSLQSRLIPGLMELAEHIGKQLSHHPDP